MTRQAAARETAAAEAHMRVVEEYEAEMRMAAAREATLRAEVARGGWGSNSRCCASACRLLRRAPRADLLR